MQIERVQETGTGSLRLTLRDGGDWLVPQPCETWHRKVIDAWLAAGGTIKALPEPTLSETRAAKLADLAARRYEAETGGITVFGMEVRTDRESQALVLGLIRRLEESPAGTTQRFKAVSGWVMVDLPTIKAVGLAIGTHVGLCFDREGQLAEEIGLAGTQADLDTIDIDADWPD